MEDTHVDELTHVKNVYSFSQDNIKANTSFFSGKTEYLYEIYPKATAFTVYIVLRSIMPQDAVNMLPIEDIVFVGRIVTLAYGTLLIFITYFFTGEFFGDGRAGLLAAGLTAFGLLKVVYSSFFLADIPATFWFYATVYLALLSFRRSDSKLLLLGGFTAGIAFGTKLLFPVLIPLAYLAREKKNRVFTVILVVLFITGFIVSTGFYYTPNNILGAFSEYFGHGVDDAFKIHEFRVVTAAKYLLSLVVGAGILVALLSIQYVKKKIRLKRPLEKVTAAHVLIFFPVWLLVRTNEVAILLSFFLTYLVYTLLKRRGRDEELIVLSPFILHFLVVCTYSYLGWRYVLPQAILVSIFAAKLIAENMRWRVLFTLLIIYQILLLVNYTYYVVKPLDSEVVGWLEKNKGNASIITDYYSSRALGKEDVLYLTDGNLLEGGVNKSAIQEVKLLVLTSRYYNKCFWRGLMLKDHAIHANKTTCEYIARLFKEETEFTKTAEFKRKTIAPELMMYEKLLDEHTWEIYKKKDWGGQLQTVAIKKLHEG